MSREPGVQRLQSQGIHRRHPRPIRLAGHLGAGDLRVRREAAMDFLQAGSAMEAHQSVNVLMHARIMGRWRGGGNPKPPAPAQAGRERSHRQQLLVNAAESAVAEDDDHVVAPHQRRRAGRRWHRHRPRQNTAGHGRCGLPRPGARRRAGRLRAPCGVRRPPTEKRRRPTASACASSC